VVDLDIENILGKVFRHKRLFNYVITPQSIEENMVICQAGNGITQHIPTAYFVRDWKLDNNIDLSTLLEYMTKYPDNTPFTTVYNDYFEYDDNEIHSYIHYDDEESNLSRFPMWKITSLIKTERDEIINPYTMIMPINDNIIQLAQDELDIMNELRADNEFLDFEDFQGFEFGLIKLLEKKYLREI